MRYPAKIRGFLRLQDFIEVFVTVNTTKHFNNGQEVGVSCPDIYVPLPGLDWSSEWVGWCHQKTPQLETRHFLFLNYVHLYPNFKCTVN